MVHHLSAGDEFLELGLQHAEFPNRCCAKTENRYFREFYGANQASISVIFVDLQTALIEEPRINKPNPVYLLMAMHWFAKYPTGGLLAGKWTVDETTARKWTWCYTQRIQALKADKVSCNELQQSHNYYTTYIF
jgi:hypothetical protein